MIYWTRADAKRRIADPRAGRSARPRASLFPFVGTIVYMIVRPPEYLDDIRERELEMQASEARLAQLSYHACQHCGQEVEKDFLICPNCHSRLREPARHCQRPLELTWSVCPYCEAPVVGGPAPAPRRHEALAQRSAAASTAADAAPSATPSRHHRPSKETVRWSARSSSPSPTPTHAT